MTISRTRQQPRIEVQCRGLARRRAPIRRTPTLIQMEAVECGAASLGIILAHHGRYVPLEELRIACGTSRDGATAKNVIDAALAYGLRGTGQRMEIPPLMELGRPVIIFWAFQHFMVVNGFEKRRGGTVVLLNDPAGGPRRMSLAEFDEGFTGIVLDFEPGPGFERRGEPSRIGGLLLERMSRSGRGLALALLASAVLVVPGILTPLFSQYYLDSVAGQDNGLGALTPLLIGLLLCSAATLLLTRVQTATLRLVEARTSLVSTGRFMHQLLRLPISFFMQRRAGELGRRITSNVQVSQTVTRDLVLTLINLLLIVVYGLVLLWQDAVLAALAILVSLLNLVVLRSVMRRRVDNSTALEAEEGRLAVATLHTISSIETVKSSGTEHASFVRWSGFLARTITESQRLGVPTALLTVVPPLLATVNSGLVMMIGGLRVADGAISVGLLFAFQALLTSFTRPLTQLTNQAGQLQEMTAQLHRLRDAERYTEDPSFSSSSGGDGIQGRVSGSVRFEQVGYTFSPLLPPHIPSLDLALEPGRRIALVGASGSGKSTVGRLAAGLLDPTSGRIVMDGRPRTDFSRQALAASVSYVDQTTVLFEGTVRENVCFWDEDIPEEHVVRALRDAEVFDDVSRRAGGINSWVTEGGRNFSGGQRQRLELARALVCGPTVLVLDEATSALDTITEQKVMDNLRRRGCAMLIIAHRLSTVRDADSILVLEGGVVIETGRHEVLMARGGRYADLVMSEQRQETIP